MGDVALHWFRKALRVHDNKSLSKAVASSNSFIALYVIDVKELNPEEMGTNRLGFLLDTLRSLDEELKDRGSRLFVAVGDPYDIICSLIEHFSVKTLTMEKDIEPEQKLLNVRIEKTALSNSVNVFSFWEYTLYDPDYLLSLENGSTDKLSSTMTSFLNLLSDASSPERPIESPIFIPFPPRNVTSASMNILSMVPTLSSFQKYGNQSGKKTFDFPAGEKEAIKRMENVLKQRDKVSTYQRQKSNPTSLAPNTTALSPYISNGSLSTRLFYHRLKETFTQSNTPGTQLPASLEGQLYWRELAYVIGSQTPNFDQMIGNPSCVCSNIPWLKGEKAKELAEQWENGETGFPAVDAAMNQMKTEGWIHHSARDLVASFLTRGGLLVYWKIGRDIFRKYFLDYDWCVNNFSWHWLSCDSFFHQAFSCSDTTSLFKTHDPTGSYIRKYVPALQEYPDEYIYEPWKAQLSEQEKAGCVVGVEYPEPIVDYDTARRNNLKKIKKAAMEFYKENLRL